jgi:hypothetical protein
MAVMVKNAPSPADLAVSLDRDGIVRLIEKEAQVLGLSADNAISQVKHGIQGQGYLWDDLSLLVSLLSE